MRLILGKMEATVSDSIVHYSFPGLKGHSLNDFIGQTVTLSHTGKFECIQCHRAIKKTFQQGYCYPCFQRLQECNLCIIHPDRCRVMEGCCPKDDWAHEQCHAKHVVYLSYTSDIKVGITQLKNVPSRWIDQGAVAATACMITQNRFLCGQIERIFKNWVNDKTNWRRMLKESADAPDLIGKWQTLLLEAKSELDNLITKYAKDDIALIESPIVQKFIYPVKQYPQKIVSLSLDKTPLIQGRLDGIKGQYLYFQEGVLNVRKYGGYAVDFLV